MLFPQMPWLAGAMLGMMVYVYTMVSAFVVPMMPVVGPARVAQVFGIMAQQLVVLFGPLLLFALLARWRPFIQWQIRRRRNRPPRTLHNEQAKLRSISYVLWGWVALTLIGPMVIIFARAPQAGYFNAESALLIGTMIAWALIVGGLVQRTGHDLVCVICNYPWQPGDPEICTECGLERVPPYGLQLGVRQRNWKLIGMGVVLMGLTIVVRLAML